MEFEDSHRKRIRERNLAAARKHRARKINFADRLVQREQDLREENQLFAKELRVLKAEMQQLTLQILTHSGCGDPLIDNFITEKAVKYSFESGLGLTAGLWHGLDEHEYRSSSYTL